jgi:phosphoenolpyruvate carboxykinase (GTP)
MTISPGQLATAPMSTSAGAGSPAELLANSNWDEGTKKFVGTGLVCDLRSFVEDAVALCKPDAVHLVDGSDAENEMLLGLLEDTGTLVKLNPALRPGCYAGRSDPADVARSMGDTFICSKDKKDAGPINNWMDPAEMKSGLDEMFDGCMRGRTMYITPFCMGPIASPAAKFCVQVTDSPYVVVHLRLTTRMGAAALAKIAYNQPEYVQLWHTVGCPITNDNVGTDEYEKARSSWPCNIPKRKIVHFPETREVWSFGSGYGGNALLGKKCVALRIASVQGRDEGWLAEHMLILGITNPAGVKKYICAAFPSACGKTNLSMLKTSLPGYKVETIGDDIAWLRFDETGQLRAVNPENGFFGVAPGTSPNTNPNAIDTIAKNSIFTNVAVTADKDVYWEGMGVEPSAGMTDWLGNADWTAGGKPAAHPNSRFTTPITQCPCLDSEWDSPEGVPIEAIVFGARRDHTMPLVYESFDWEHGVFVGASMRSNATSAAEQTGVVHDPMAMSPFIGYNVKDYFSHWLSMPDKAAAAVTAADGEATLPKIFHINWFQRDAEKNFSWPGFNENARVLAWILKRCDGSVDAEESAIGLLPKAGDIDLDGMDGFGEADMAEQLRVDGARWADEAAGVREYFEKDLLDGDAGPVPAPLMQQLAALEARLGAQ